MLGVRLTAAGVRRAMGRGHVAAEATTAVQVEAAGGRDTVVQARAPGPAQVPRVEVPGAEAAVPGKERTAAGRTARARPVMVAAPDGDEAMPIRVEVGAAMGAGARHVGVMPVAVQVEGPPPRRIAAGGTATACLGGGGVAPAGGAARGAPGAPLVLTGPPDAARPEGAIAQAQVGLAVGGPIVAMVAPWLKARVPAIAPAREVVIRHHVAGLAGAPRALAGAPVAGAATRPEG